eukprot:scpid112128/ scgid13234/ 
MYMQEQRVLGTLSTWSTHQQPVYPLEELKIINMFTPNRVARGPLFSLFFSNRSKYPQTESLTGPGVDTADVFLRYLRVLDDRTISTTLIPRLSGGLGPGT